MGGRRRALVLGVATAFVLAGAVIATAAITGRLGGRSIGVNPDLPPLAQGRGETDTANYLQLRDEFEANIRGLEPGLFFNPAWREQAVETRFRQERALRTKGVNSPITWTEIGPDTVPNGQTQQYPTTAAVSGRVTSIAVDPTDNSKVYLGTAQGGVWRTTDGGTNWTPLFDSAASLSIGALALAGDNTTLYVGTGEPNNSGDSYFGVGVYRTDNADTTATLVGPINPTVTTGSGAGTVTTKAFYGRAISKILVDPNDPATIFV